MNKFQVRRPELVIRLVDLTVAAIAGIPDLTIAAIVGILDLAWLALSGTFIGGSFCADFILH